VEKPGRGRARLRALAIECRRAACCRHRSYVGGRYATQRSVATSITRTENLRHARSGTLPRDPPTSCCSSPSVVCALCTTDNLLFSSRDKSSEEEVAELLSRLHAASIATVSAERKRNYNLTDSVALRWRREQQITLLGRREQSLNAYFSEITSYSNSKLYALSPILQPANE